MSARLQQEERLKSQRYWRMIATLQFMTVLIFASAYALIARVPSHRLPRVFTVPAAFGLYALLHHLFVCRAERRLTPAVPSAIARQRTP